MRKSTWLSRSTLTVTATLFGACAVACGGGGSPTIAQSGDDAGGIDGGVSDASRDAAHPDGASASDGAATDGTLNEDAANEDAANEDAGVVDSATSDAEDASVVDAFVADGGGCNTPTQCLTSGSAFGFDCSATDGGACSACSGTTGTSAGDDALCAATYGAGFLCTASGCIVGCGSNADCSGGQACLTSTRTCGPCGSSSDCSSGSVCSGGACVVGNCATSSDCGVSSGTTAGQVCVNNTCSNCVDDTSCSTDAVYAAASENVCIGGSCTAGTCTSATGVAAATECNSAAGVSAKGDACCSNKCVPGTTPPTGGQSCCGNGYDITCPSAMHNCENNVCTSCSAPVANNGTTTLWVNPATPQTSGGTGTAGNSCEFSNLAHALAYAKTLSGAIVINLVGDTSSTNGETFPLVVPNNVTIQGVTSGSENGSLTVQTHKVIVSAGLTGFTVGASSSATLQYLEITGSAATTEGASSSNGGRGILVGGSGAALSINNVSVQYMTGDGIAVGYVKGSGASATNLGGSLTIGNNTTIQNNGTVTGSGSSVSAVGDGLRISGTGSATIGGSSASAIVFRSNASHNIEAVVGGTFSLTGQVTQPASGAATGTVTLSGSTFANIYINQTATMLSSILIKGALTKSSGNGRGINILAGSHVTIRNTTTLGNAANPGPGVILSPNGSNNDVSGVNLGSSTVTGSGDTGNNTFQIPNGSALGDQNTTGVCIEVTAPASAIPAEGNFWVTDGTPTAAQGCQTGQSGMITAYRTCAKAPSGEVSSIGGVGSQATAGATINVTNCSVQLR